MIVHLLILIALLHASDCYGIGANSPEKFITPASTTSCSLTAQDFTTYTENDTGSDDLSVTAGTVTFEINPVPTSRVYKSFSSTPLDGDFTILEKVRFSTVQTNAKAYLVAVTQSVPETFYNLTDNHAFFQVGSNGTRYFRLGVVDDGELAQDGSNFEPALDTDYFITFTRKNGVYRAYIRTTSHTGTLIDMLTLPADSGAPNEFSVVYAFSNWETESGSYSVVGTVNDMEVGLCAE